MRARTILQSGAKVVAPLQFVRSRPKVSGYMWDGSMELEKEGIRYHFQMWYHGGDEMSEGEAIDQLSLKGITYQGKFYDVYWYTVMTEEEIWLHPTGWFGGPLGGSQLEKEVMAIRKANYNFQRDQLTYEQKQELTRLGFIKIASVGYQDTVTRVLKDLGKYQSPEEFIKKFTRFPPKFP